MGTTRASSRRERGFTLMEILVSLAIVATMVTLIWGSFSMTARTKRKVEDIEDRYHQIRLAMTRMTREISMAFLSKNDVPGTQNPRTMFVGLSNSSVDDLTFSNLAHMRLREDAKESDQSVVRYYSAPDREDRRQTNLMRRESRRLGDEKPGEEGPAYVMLEDVEELHFEYFDGPANEWKDTWNTRSADGMPDRLPTKVRIKLTVVDERGEEMTYITATRVFLKDPLWFSSGR